ncbi:N-acetylglucosamine-specific PTS transporter subunit IIBC [Macrococcus equipercicus]|uniref:N-acetylglucosamine-specific PTS transporter subunit IIBC n=1 Tax=Macrococcus equipercicus TaxID=69967 RepID=A0A9Q9F2U0_9STAP|nr:N-acetylglucosamine-specific PTS transporter subunit IIBC [Macrococcus equipercicus]KAA1038429.1 PTS glucose transporter subunit IIBC [Macrococcus equipercicus]UTH13184.1 N-acetylglucosamine-specific PTS transporter subunit IIBC [Macrococcus equipercicus]
MFSFLQRIGRSLMLPVAVLPAAALLLGIGYWIDPTGWGANNPVAGFLIKAGSAILDHLGMLFAIGVALGMSKSKDGAAALAAVVGFMVVTTVLSTASVANLMGIAPEQVNKGFEKIDNVFVGILVGLIAAWTFNKFHQTELPAALAFFSGRRLVPILVSFFAMLLSLVLLFVWPFVFGALVSFGEWMLGLGAVGAGLFGFFNRLLIPVGLHHALNTVFWFDVAGIDDIKKFQSKDAVKGVTGMYQAGFFPVMMFGVPGAALAMYHSAKSARKKAVAGIFLAGAVSAFLTGVTEPVEFAFMFVAPALYFVHAVLTGLSMFIAASFHWTAGFGFSAGFIDYLLSLKNPNANHPLMLLVLGVIYFALYYIIFRFAIKVLDIKTPGRESDEEIAAMALSEGDEVGPADEVTADNLSSNKYDALAQRVIQGVGGPSNIEHMTNCATRLRFELKNNRLVDEQLLKQAGSAGVIKTGQKNAQVIIGTHVQQVADAVEHHLK